MNLTSFALRRGALITLILVFATALAACSGNSDESQPADGDGGNGTATVADGAVEITAEGLAFDATTIEAAAGEDFTITLVNNDSAPHNISIYTEEGGESAGDRRDRGSGPDRHHRRQRPRCGRVLLPVRHPPGHERVGRRQRLTRSQLDR